jgi:hypothetical protein
MLELETGGGCRKLSGVAVGCRLGMPSRSRPPLLRPYSAVVFPVSTLNSASASGLVRSGEKFEPPALVSFVSIPSSVKFHDRSRAPFTWMPPPVFAPDTTPSCVGTRSRGLRPRPPTMGRLSMVR